MPPHARKILAGLILLASAHAATAQAPAILRAHDAWVGCLQGRSLALAQIHRAEPAESVVNAAFGECAPQATELQNAMLADRMALALVDQTLARMRVISRDQLLALVLQVRSQPLS